MPNVAAISACFAVSLYRLHIRTPFGGAGDPAGPHSGLRAFPSVPLAGVNETFFDAAIVIASPVDGLRPWRSGRSLTANLPKPAIETSSPLAAAPAICSNTAAIAALACCLARACRPGDTLRQFTDVHATYSPLWNWPDLSHGEWRYNGAARRGERRGCIDSRNGLGGTVRPGSGKRCERHPNLVAEQSCRSAVAHLLRFAKDQRCLKAAIRWLRL